MKKPDPDLERLVDTALAQLRQKMLQELSDGAASQGTLDQIEEAVTRLGDEFRRSLQQQIVSKRSRGSRDNTIDCSCGGRARFRALRLRRLLTTHGPLILHRPYYHCPSCQRGSSPLDDALALDAGSTSRALRLWIADLSARLPFAEATTVLAQLTGIRLGVSTVERTAVAVGEALRAAQQQEAQKHQQGKGPRVQHKPRRLYISLDGIYAPLRDPWKLDGSTGPLACRFAECKTGVVYEARSGPKGDEGVRSCAYIATFADTAAFAPLLSTLAHRSGQHFAREVIVLADGAAWIWTLAAAQFPGSLEIVDYFHAKQHLFAVARTVLGEGTPETKAWVKAREAELFLDRVSAVVSAIGALPCRSREQQEMLEREQRYFRENAERMRYGSFRKKGYQIGSGVMEATCKRVVGQRLDEAGMHWRQESAEAIVALRAAVLSSRPPDLRPYCHFAPSPLPQS